MNKIYNCAVIGCGVVAEDHINAINSMENAKLVAFCDTNKEILDTHCEKYGAKGYTDLEEMLKDESIDICAICTPSATHTFIGTKVANAKKHLVVEKPIDISLEKADELIACCKRNDVKLSCIVQNRYDRASIELKKAIDAGKLGKLHFGSAHVKWYRDEEYYANAGWRGTWEMDGGGALINQSIHTIDLLLHFMGEAESVCGMCGTFTHSNIEVEDTGVAIIRFKSGAVGIIEGTTSCYPGLGNRVDICGSKGTVILNNREVHTWELLNKEQYVADESLPLRGRHVRHFEDVIYAIENKCEPKINGEEVRKALEIVMAIYKSSRTGEVVKL